MKVDEKPETQREKDIKQCTASIERESLFLYEKHAWLTQNQRNDIRQRIQMLMANREKLIGDGQKGVKLLPPLKVPGPQPPEEILALHHLIDSV